MDRYTYDPKPWRRLAAAILVRAIRDALLNKKYMDEAIQWLHSEDAIFFMDYLNQDPEEAYRKLGVSNDEGNCNWS